MQSVRGIKFGDCLPLNSIVIIIETENLGLLGSTAISSQEQLGFWKTMFDAVCQKKQVWIGWKIEAWRRSWEDEN